MDAIKYVISKRKQHANAVGDEFTDEYYGINNVIVRVFTQIDDKTYDAHVEDIDAISRGDFGHYFISDEDFTYNIRVTL